MKTHEIAYDIMQNNTNPNEQKHLFINQTVQNSLQKLLNKEKSEHVLESECIYFSKD